MTEGSQQDIAPESLDPSSLADWAEAVMFIESRRRLSRSVLRSRLQARLLIETEEELAYLLDDLLTEIGQRSRIAQDGYPFARTDAGITRACTVNESPMSLCYGLLLAQPIESKIGSRRLTDSLTRW